MGIKSDLIESMVLEAFNHNYDDEHEYSNYIPIEIPLEEDYISVSYALPHPIAMMTKTLTAQITCLAVDHGVVNK
jgi:hypothetical protein